MRPNFVRQDTYISCCGFYCKTCKEFIANLCRGCKLGYENKQRDINKAKCKIKLCCFKENQFNTCAECKDFKICEKIMARFKPGTYNNKKSLELLEFLATDGYSAYIAIAEDWKNHYGKLKK